MFRINNTARGWGLTVALVTLGGCASAPPAPPAPTMSAAEKVARILALEDRRVLTEPVEDGLADPVLPDLPVRRGTVTPVPALPPDLAVLARDADGQVRRRAALAIGRVGLPEGLPALTALLEDSEPEVRAMAAFAIGLIGSPDGVMPLTGALKDLSPRVQGRAAEGLGLIGDSTAAKAVADMAVPYVAHAAAVSGDAPTADAEEATAWRLAAYALVRLRDWDNLSRIAIGSDGMPVTTWWPLAYALQRIDQAGAVPALRILARAGTPTTVAFALRGLGDQRDAVSRPLFASIAGSADADAGARIAAVRALARLGGAESRAALEALMTPPPDDSNLRLEVVTALGAVGDASTVELLLDRLADDWPVMRIAALTALARVDPDNFTLVLSGLLPDPDWRVRAATARLLTSLPGDAASARLHDLWDDADNRVHGAALSGAVEVKLPEAERWLKEALGRAADGARAAAVSQIGRGKPSWGPDALREAYRDWASEPDYSARAAALTALAAYGANEAVPTLIDALADRDWAVRLRARALLQELAPDRAVLEIRPVPNTWPDAVYADPAVVAPPYSPRVSIDTTRGTIEIELNVLDAALTTRNFLELARRGFYDGIMFHRVVPNFVIQAGDPRGDGQGGAGRTIRDELHPAPFLAGTVGMALSGPDTGGSQFFITVDPAPHLDARFTVFGHVVSGLDVVGRIRQGDVIQRMRVRDGS